MKTRFQNLFYLALNKLNIVNKQQEKINTELNSYNANLIIPNQTGMILNLLEW
jgi:hypothetical protein